MKKIIFLSVLSCAINSAFTMDDSWQSTGLQVGKTIHITTQTHSIQGTIVHIEHLTLFIKDPNLLNNPDIPCHVIDLSNTKVKKTGDNSFRFEPNQN